MTDKILFWNCCGGLRSKIDTVRLIINKFQPLAMFISEAELKSNHETSWFSIQGYEFNHSSTLKKHEKSRLISYTRSNSNLKVRMDLIKNENVEIIPIDYLDTRIIGIYRPFKLHENMTKETAIQEFINTLKSLEHGKTRLIYGGDFNVNLKKDDPDSRTLRGFQDDLALQQLVTKPTWSRIVDENGKQRLRKSTLDLVFTNIEDVLVKIDDPWSSDHKLVIALLPNKHKQGINREKFIVRNWSEYNPARASHLARKLIDTITEEDLDVNRQAQQIEKLFLKVQDKLCPERVVRTSRQSDIKHNNIEKIKKKRKRLMHKINTDKRLTEEEIEHALSTIKSLNRDLKIAIKRERKHLISTKLQSKDPKCFWSTIRQIEGKQIRQNVDQFIINGKSITDGNQIANEFIQFFTSKVNNLSKNEQSYHWARSSEHVIFSIQDLTDALSTFKRKLSKGSDGIMMKTIRDCSSGMMDYLLALMNKAASEGIPESWRLAKIIPLHKKGNKQEIENYRPIANLQSISKLYEKMLLQKINEMVPGIEGFHQHGFQKAKSTTTALLELQSEISHKLDAGFKVATYSIDMSAAFDLLRPHLFHQLDIPPVILNPIIDFLSQRRMMVQHEKFISETVNMPIGCVQGSVLGPKLFSIYCKDLANALIPSAHLVSYADDSYVTVANSDYQLLKEDLQTCINQHEEFMERIGMVVNKQKTELVVFSKKDDITIELSNGIKSSQQFKALGVIFTKNLSWDTHITQIINKTSKTINSIKFLRRYITSDNALKITTSQYFGQAYYGAPIWLNKTLSFSQWDRLNRQHYRALRAAIGDYSRKIPRVVLDVIAKRATPKEWSNYINASTAIKVYNNGNTRIGQQLREKGYINDRRPNRAVFIDQSRKMIGQHQLVNRLQCMSDLDFPWIGEESQHTIRRSLKKAFFKNGL